MVDDVRRRLDGYTISSPCEPNGSGELTTFYAVKPGPPVSKFEHEPLHDQTNYMYLGFEF